MSSMLISMDNLVYLLIFVIIILWSLISYDSKLPVPLPIIGHLHLLGKSPHQSLTNLARKYGPCFFLKLGSYPTLLISSAETAKEALKIQDVVFSSRPDFAAVAIISYNHSGIMWSPYGELWRNVRKLCNTELLTTKRVESFMSVRAQEMSTTMSSLLKWSRASQVVNLRDILTDLTFNIMTRMMISKSYSGGKDEEAWKFKVLIGKGAVAIGDVYIGDHIPWLGWLGGKEITNMKEYHKEMDAYLQKQIDEHRDNPSKFSDFISIMLANEISPSETLMKSTILDMLAGGTETSATTVEWGLTELLKHPEMLSKVKEELDSVVGKDSLVKETDLENLKYLTAVVKETLRLHPPAPILMYSATQACQFGKYYVPEKTRVFVNVYAIGRDESYWKEPVTFNPERFMNTNIDVRGRNFEVIPFGSGRRGCPGIHMGMTMVQFMLASLLHGFDWEMPGKVGFEELDMSEGVGLVIARSVPLELVPVARLDSNAYGI